MAEADIDPRHKGFSEFSLRPSTVSADDPQDLPSRRGIAGPPPPKPTVEAPELPAVPADETVEPPPSAPAVDVEWETVEPDAAAPPQVRRTDKPAEPRQLGVQRHHMRYVQFQASPTISDLLTARAEEEDVVLGEIVMDALRHLKTQPTPERSSRRRRRSAAGSVRRSVLIRPEEADEIRLMADDLGYTPSALIRTALELYLS